MDKVFGILRADYIMILLVLYLFFKTFPKRKESLKHRAFFDLLSVGFVMSCLIFLINGASQHIFFFTPEVSYFLTLAYYWSLCLMVYGIFCYNEITLESIWINKISHRLLLSAPLIAYFLLLISSYWNHHVFYFDGYSRLHSGNLAFLHYLLPVIYASVMILRIFFRVIKERKFNAYYRGLLYFPVILIIGIYLQYRFELDHVAMSIISALVVAYLELFSVEDHKLEKASALAESMHKQYQIIEALSRDFEDVYLLDVKRGSSTSFKLKGKLVNEKNRLVQRYSNSYKQYIDKFIHPDDKERVRKLFRIEEVEKALLSSPSYGFTYRAVIDGDIHHYQARYLVSEDNVNFTEKIILGYQCIDEIVKMHHNSYEDNLTGLNNRHAFEELMEKYNSDGMNSNLVVIAIDVNGLKQVNDIKGHSAGDELLMGVSQCLKDSLLAYGKVFRMGGDEFVALVEADGQQLQSMLEDMSSRIDNWKGKLVEKASLSYGFTSLNENPDYSFNELYKLADQRMYENKAEYYRKKNNLI